MLPIGDVGVPRRTFPFFTYGLIAVNVMVFLYELQLGNPFIGRWAFIPSRFAADPARYWITIFTSLFFHASWLHLGGNMLYLWIFGDNVEDRFGHFSYLVFYFLCGLAATLTQFAFETGSNVPNLGASGAIAGVLGAYFLMFPRAKVDVLLILFVIEVPALLLIGLWFVLQLLSGIGSIYSAAQAGGVAYLAHVGGFVGGIALTFFFRRRR
jgi:membrane associated rhomboid family serine protease